MRKRVMYLVSAMVVGTVAAAMVSRSQQLHAQQTQQPSAPVTVVNTPLPVALSGIGSISGTVNVASLPAVQLAAGTKVLVSDVDNPARHALVLDLCARTGGIACSEPSSATLPVGTRYVIEQVSGRCLVNGEHIRGMEHTFGSGIYSICHATLSGYLLETTPVFPTQ